MTQQELNSKGFEFRRFKKTWRLRYPDPIPGRNGFAEWVVIARGRRTNDWRADIKTMCDAATAHLVFKRVTQ